MPQKRTADARRGFALPEAATVFVMAAVLAALIVVLGAGSRRLARLGEDAANLRQIGAWTMSYGADHQDLLWSFSWKKGQAHSQWPDLNYATSDIQATSNQAVDILRRVGGRTDIQAIQLWIPHVLYSHLVLADYVQAPMPERTFISVADERRLAWARDPAGFDKGHYTPSPYTPGFDGSKRWPYSASYVMPACFYDGAPPANRIAQASNHNTYVVSTLDGALGGRPNSEVAFPSAKVLMHDQHARHFGARVPYCTHDQARVPLLFIDGSVSVRAAGDSNAGWVPTQPAAPTPTQINYAPALWEPPTMSGGSSDAVIGRYRWTRGTATQHGLVGRDFAGPETCSGQPGCP